MKIFMMAAGAAFLVSTALASSAFAKQSEFQTHTSKPGQSCTTACALGGQGLAGLVIVATPATSGDNRLCTCKYGDPYVVGTGGTLGGVKGSVNADIHNDAAIDTAPASATGVSGIGAAQAVTAPAAKSAVAPVPTQK